MNLESIKDFIKHNAGTILTVVSCAGVVGTAVCAAHDAVKARQAWLRGPRARRPGLPPDPSPHQFFLFFPISG